LRSIYSRGTANYVNLIYVILPSNCALITLFMTQITSVKKSCPCCWTTPRRS